MCFISWDICISGPTRPMNCTRRYSTTLITGTVLVSSSSRHYPLFQYVLLSDFDDIAYSIRTVDLSSVAASVASFHPDWMIHVYR